MENFFAENLNRKFSKEASLIGKVMQRVIKHELNITPEQKKEIKGAATTAKILAADVSKRTGTDVVAVLAFISGELNNTAMEICGKEEKGE